MLRRRTIVLPQDRDTLLEFHCRINYASETPYARRVPYEVYRQKWLSTSQTESFLAHLAETMQDERTIAEIWEEDGVAVGYLWVMWIDLPDYDMAIAEVMDLAVAPGYLHRGIGSELLRYAENTARKRGARLLRSDTGSENTASQRLHEKREFRPYRIVYEKVLRYSPAGASITVEKVAPALAEAIDLLQLHGYDDVISADDLCAYAAADTFYPSAISWEEILGNRLIVAHEVVEIAELKRMGLEIDKGVIVENQEAVYAAHLRAGQVEMAIAQAMGEHGHIRDRLKAVRDWVEDPLLPAGLRDHYQNLYAQICQALAEQEG